MSVGKFRDSIKTVTKYNSTNLTWPINKGGHYRSLSPYFEIGSDVVM